MLISESYRTLNKQLHDTNASYGISGHTYAGLVEGMAICYQAKSILDYGCGKGTLKQALPHLPIAEYDPCIVGKEATPAPADIVICNDVLEHIEPDCLHDVLADLARVTLKLGILVADLIPAVKFLADGRNAHILLGTDVFWREAISEHFEVITVQPEKFRKLVFIVRPKPPVLVETDNA